MKRNIPEQKAPQNSYLSKIISSGGNTSCPRCAKNGDSLNCHLCEGSGAISIEHKNVYDIPSSEMGDTSTWIDETLKEQEVAQVHKHRLNDWLKMLLSLLLLLALLWLLIAIILNNAKPIVASSKKDQLLDKQLDSSKKKNAIRPKKQSEGNGDGGSGGVGDIDRDKIDRNLYFYGELVNKEMLGKSKVDWSNITKADIDKVTPRLKQKVEALCREQASQGKECYPDVLGHPSLKNRQYKRIGEKVFNELKSVEVK